MGRRRPDRDVADELGRHGAAVVGVEDDPELAVGAAPPHFHLYDEVIYVLDGHGVMHMGGAQTPLSAGSAISLPAREVHTLANSGPGVMRVLGVFRPAGSPAEAYYPDGTPAQVAGEPQTAAVSR